MFRVVIIFKNGTISKGQNFKTKGEVEDYILKESEKQEIKRADIRNLDTGERERIF
jgi:hypothetical protein